MIALTIENYLTQIDNLELPDEAASYLYAQRSIIKLFLYALIKGITHFKTLHQQLLEKPAILGLVGLANVPTASPYLAASRRCPTPYGSS